MDNKIKDEQQEEEIILLYKYLNIKVKIIN